MESHHGGEIEIVSEQGKRLQYKGGRISRRYDEKEGQAG
jgi:hypothetical protein